jgi:hypothetical protein
LKCLPWADTSWRGNPKHVMMGLKKNRATMSIVLLNVGMVELDSSDYDIFVPIVGWGVASHEMNTPFAKGAYRNDWIEGSGW